MEWAHIWDLSRIESTVINGDGASWIDKGAEQFPKAVRQLDGFHLARACLPVADRPSGLGGGAIYEAIRSGDGKKAERLLNEASPKTKKRAEKAQKFMVFFKSLSVSGLGSIP